MLELSPVRVLSENCHYDVGQGDKVAIRYVNSRKGKAVPLIACHAIWVGIGTPPRLQWEKDTDERSASYPGLFTYGGYKLNKKLG